MPNRLRSSDWRRESPQPQAILTGKTVLVRAIHMSGFATCLGVAVIVSVSLSSPGTMDIVVQQDHFSIGASDGWTYSRNVGAFELILYGPTNGGMTIPYFTVGVGVNPGLNSDSDLYSELTYQMKDLVDSYPGSTLEILSAPFNTTISGERACEVTARFLEGSRDTVIWSGLVVSHDWNLMYSLMFIDDYFDWENDKDICNEIVDSFHIERRAHLSVTTMVAIATVGAIVAIAVIAILSFRRKRRGPQRKVNDLSESVQRTFGSSPP